YNCYFLIIFFFFFQAEDGIRDKLVTGVQTCALPISKRKLYKYLHADSTGPCRGVDGATGVRRRDEADISAARRPSGEVAQREWRSEERRAGKECRSRWSPDH